MRGGLEGAQGIQRDRDALGIHLLKSLVVHGLIKPEIVVPRSFGAWTKTQHRLRFAHFVPTAVNRSHTDAIDNLYSGAPCSIPFNDRDGLDLPDGELLPWREARLHRALTHALHMGGPSSRARAHGGHVPTAPTGALPAVRRAVGLPPAVVARRTDTGQQAVLWANQLDDLHPPGGRSGAARRAFHRFRRAARIHVAIAAWDWPMAASQGRAEEGIRVAGELAASPVLRPRPPYKCSGLYT